MKRRKNRVASATADSLGALIALDYTDDDLEQSYRAVALFAGTVATVIAAAGFILRLGFRENSPLEWAKYLSVSWFLIDFSFAIRGVFRKLGVNFRNHWWTSHATLALIGLSLTALAGVDESSVTSIFGMALEAVGVATAVWLLLSRLRTARIIDTAVVLGFAFFFGLFAIGASWGLGYQNPNFIEGMCFGRAQIDTLYHATLANMLRTYGLPSTGLDGLPYILYHFGSHWLFGRLCNLLHVPIIDFYNRGYAVLFIPFGVFSLGTLALTLSRRWQTFREMSDRFESLPTTSSLSLVDQSKLVGPRFWFLLTAIYIGVLPYSAGLLTAAAWNSVIVSESYALAVAVSLLGFAAALAFFRCSYDNPDLWAGDRVLGIAFLSAALGAIGLLKISVMLVLIAGGVYLFFRVCPYLFRLAAAGTLLAASLILVACAFVFTANPEYSARNGFAPFAFLRENVAPEWWGLFWLPYYAWCWFLIAARLYETGVRNLQELRTALREGRLLDVEFAVAIAVIGSVPGLFLTGDSNTHYFSEYQHWIAAAFLLAFALRSRHWTVAGRGLDRSANQSMDSVARSWSGRLTVVQLSKNVVILAVVGTVLTNTLGLLNGAVGAALTSRGLDWNNANTRADLLNRGVVQFLHEAEGAAKETDQRLQKEKNVLSVLRSLGQMPLAEKRRSLLFIPKSNSHYWQLLRGPYSPKDSPFVAPALSGIAMIDGLYPRPEGDLWTGYGFQHYPIPKSNATQPPLDEYLPTLRNRCLQMGFPQLIVLTSDANGMSTATKYECR